MADRILTTHVGSLVRPPKFIEVLRAIENKQPLPDGTTYEAALREAVAQVVREQAEAGVDIVSDGEYGKVYNWAFYVHSRISGVTARPLTAEEAKDPMATAGGGRDREAFPEYYAEADKATGLAARLGNRFIVNGPIRYTGHKDLARDIDNLKAALGGVKVEGAFLPVVAPASAMPGAKNEHYKDDREFLFALAEALRVEYRAIVDAGLNVQVDDAFFPFMHEKLVPPMTEKQYRDWAQLRIDALNHALEGIPLDKSRYHICWGSWSGPHVYDVPMKDIIDIVLQVNVGAYSFEAANVRHEHEWKVWKTARLPAGKKLLPGVISHATNVVEHPELIADRLIRYASIVGRENVIASSDCGFAQSPFAARVHRTIMWAKLRAMAEGARLATRELWGKSAAA